MIGRKGAVQVVLVRLVALLVVRDVPEHVVLHVQARQLQHHVVVALEVVQEVAQVVVALPVQGLLNPRHVVVVLEGVQEAVQVVVVVVVQELLKIVIVTGVKGIAILHVGLHVQNIVLMTVKATALQRVHHHAIGDSVLEDVVEGARLHAVARVKTLVIQLAMGDVIQLAMDDALEDVTLHVLALVHIIINIHERTDKSLAGWLG